MVARKRRAVSASTGARRRRACELAVNDRHVLVLGAGGHAKVVIATLQAVGRAVYGILDDDDALHGSYILGVPVIGRTNDAKGFKHLEAIIAIGDNQARRQLAR